MTWRKLSQLCGDSDTQRVNTVGGLELAMDSMDKGRLGKGKGTWRSLACSLVVRNWRWGWWRPAKSHSKKQDWMLALATKARPLHSTPP